jgi:hypothetical protein
MNSNSRLIIWILKDLLAQSKPIGDDFLRWGRSIVERPVLKRQLIRVSNQAPDATPKNKYHRRLNRGTNEYLKVRQGRERNRFQTLQCLGLRCFWNA